MLKIQGKQTPTQGAWETICTSTVEYMAIQMADTYKKQGQYKLVRVVDANGMMVYQAA
jgi:hypothetical protein